MVYDLAEYPWRDAPREGQKVRVGFRPEHFVQEADADRYDRTLRMQFPIQFLEKAGPDAIAFLDVPGETIAVRVDAHVAEQYRRDPNASVLLPLGKVNVFDAESGRRM